ncbi:hypothetical protein GCM10010206_66010 [Streptomyces cinerochromogenes]|nr:hypothetical protein GCM10010206_66010 [Streptomyces cinerochromogenes]
MKTGHVRNAELRNPGMGDLGGGGGRDGDRRPDADPDVDPQLRDAPYAQNLPW